MESLPLVLYTLMLEITAGSFAVLMLTDFWGEVGRSFLITGGLTALATAGIARWVASAVIFQNGQKNYPTDLSWEGFQNFWLIASLVLLTLYNLMVWLGTDKARRVVGLAALFATALTLLGNALLYRGEYLGGWIAPVSFIAGAVSVGAVLTGMLLGHWYLVTPALSVSPLTRINTIFFWTLVAQAGLVVINLGPWASGADKMWEQYGAVFWLRVAIGIVFPLILAVATWQTCKLKAHMSSTGFLYVALGCVLAGEIVSRVILFQTYVPL
jgi:hypothetical protein